MGAVPGTFSRRKESQAPGPRAVYATRGRWVVAGTMPCPARPGEREKSAAEGPPSSSSASGAAGPNDAELELGGPVCPSCMGGAGARSWREPGRRLRLPDFVEPLGGDHERRARRQHRCRFLASSWAVVDCCLLKADRCRCRIKTSRSVGLLVRRGYCRGRPSVAPSARSLEGDGKGLRPRRWSAGGLPRGVESCTGTVYRGGCPVGHCAERGGQPGGHRRHNVEPGTPR